MPAGTVEAQARLRKLIIRLNPIPCLQVQPTGWTFGGSVADITEGNAISSLGFAFSTGDYLDSLQWSGQVRDAETDLPLRGITVALYPQAVWPSLLQGDSIKPERWTLTNDSGFCIQKFTKHKLHGIGLSGSGAR